MRAVQFFEGSGRRLSMSRLLVFLAFWPSTWVLVGNPTEAMMGLFLGAFVLNYLGGKGADIFMGSEKLEDGSSSNTSGATNVTSSSVEKRSTETTGSKRRAF